MRAVAPVHIHLFIPEKFVASTRGPREAMILHPAAWVILVIGAIVIVWFSIQDD